MATHNNITNDKLISRHLSDKGRENYDKIFGKKKKLKCPVCGSEKITTERRPNGDSHCENGHSFPTSSALE